MCMGIAPVKYEAYDCFENNILSALKTHFQIDYRPYFWSGLDFRWSADESFSAVRISGYNPLQSRILSEQCGAEILTQAKPDIQVFRQAILAELKQNRPIGLQLNGSDLPWNRTGLKMDRHYLLVTAADKNAERLSCCDGYLSDTVQSIDCRFLYEKAESMLVFRIRSIPCASLCASLDRIYNCIQENNTRKKESLVSLCRKGKAILERYGQENPDSHPVIMQLARVCRSRQLFIQSLAYFKDTFSRDVFSSLRHCCLPLTEAWTMLKNLFIKTIISGCTTPLDRYGARQAETVCSLETEAENLCRIQIQKALTGPC